jgi:hypothetical protein
MNEVLEFGQHVAALICMLPVEIAIGGGSLAVACAPFRGNKHRFSRFLRTDQYLNLLAMSLPHTIELEILKPDVHHGQATESIVRITPGTSPDAPPAQAATRFSYFNQPEKHIELKYSSNLVTTSKYTLLSFLPKTLFEQFQRLANIFFIIVSGLQVFTNLSPTGRCVQLLPIAVPAFTSHHATDSPPPARSLSSFCSV